MRGTVVKVIADASIVHTGDGEWRCLIRSRLLKREKSFPIAVGDEVEFDVIDDTPVITKRLPRRTKLSRESTGDERVEQVICANIDQLIVTASTKQPPPNLRTIDRMLVAGENSELSSLLCINKIDLDDSEKVRQIKEIYESVGYKVILTSALRGDGIGELRSALKNKISVFAGESGVGKSSLLMALQPSLKLVTREVAPATKRGRHATSSVSLLKLNFGGFVLDTPGINQFKTYDIQLEELASCFPEFHDFMGRCRFRNCLHRDEPDCAVENAVKKGIIPHSRYKSYLHILADIEERQLPPWLKRPRR